MSAHLRRAITLPLTVLFLVCATAGAPRAGLVTELPGLVSNVVNAVTQVVDGALGAVLRTGLWTVQIPAGAFAGTATVSLNASASNPTVCGLEIAPASKNGFANPVTLTARIPLGMSASSARIEWFNPQTQAWDPVPGSSVNLLTRTVSAKIWHFSQYRVDGRSGW